MFNSEDRKNFESMDTRLKIVNDLISSINRVTNDIKDKDCVKPHDLSVLNDTVEFNLKAIYGRFEDTLNRIKSVSDSLCNITNYLSVIEDIKDKLSELTAIKDKVENYDSVIDKKLLEFRKEFMDKYFDNLNSFIRWNKEMVLISSLTSQPQDNIDDLKKELLKPYIEEKNKLNDIKKSEEINSVLSSNGEKIRALRKQLYDKYIQYDREEKDPLVVAPIKAQVDLLDMIIGGNL